MGSSVVAHNYAETLLALAQRHGGEEAVEDYAAAIEDVAEILEREPLIREFLQTPRVDLDAKKRALHASFAGRVPDLFLRFLLIVVEKRRQGVLRQIAKEYHLLVDETRGRTRADVLLARAADDRLQKEIVSTLERRLGKKVIATFAVDPSLVGGLIIRVDGQILDGSLRRKAVGLRRRMIEAKLPAAGFAVGETYEI
jgi:F-type H+-transporting ATPase subunit delta